MLLTDIVENDSGFFRFCLLCWGNLDNSTLKAATHPAVYIFP
jgi:hypothetical protein